MVCRLSNSIGKEALLTNISQYCLKMTIPYLIGPKQSLQIMLHACGSSNKLSHTYPEHDHISKCYNIYV